MYLNRVVPIAESRIFSLNCEVFTQLCTVSPPGSWLIFSAAADAGVRTVATPAARFCVDAHNNCLMVSDCVDIPLACCRFDAVMQVACFDVRPSHTVALDNATEQRRPLFPACPRTVPAPQ